MAEIFKNKKILFVLAHLDDETFGFGGSLQRLAKDNQIYFCILCKGRNEENSKERVRSFINIMKTYNISTNQFYLGDSYDMEIDNILLKDLTDIISNEINTIKPDIIITNSSNDLHQDHIKVSHATKIASRENKNNEFLKELYELQIPGSEHFSSTYFDTKIKLTRNEIQNKMHMCNIYKTENQPIIHENEYLKTVFRRL